MIRNFTNRGHVFWLSALLVPFGVYLYTLAHTVSFFDSGELITAGATMGLSHPPGYPLYVITSYFFSLFPIGNLAFRVNVASAFFGALTVMVLYLVTLHIADRIHPGTEMKNRVSSLASSLLFAFSLNQWGQTSIAEVYALNSLFIGLAVLALLTWDYKILGEDSDKRSSQTRYLYLFGFIFGLGFGNHHTILVLVPMLFFIVLTRRWQLLFDINRFFVFLFFFILGFSVYLYLPLRASGQLVMNWGDPDTWKQFKWVFFREGYPKGSIYRSWSLFFKQLESINILYEFSIAGFIVGIIGLVRYLKTAWRFIVLSFIVLFVLSVGVIIAFSADPENIFLYEAFHTPTYMFFAPWIGMGIYFIMSLIEKLFTRLAGERNLAALTVFLWTAVLLTPSTLLFVYHLRSNDRTNNFIAFDYAMNSLKSVSPNGILFTWGDSGAFPLWYLHFIEKYKPGMLLLHTPHLASDWYVDEIPELKQSYMRRIPQAYRTPGAVVEFIVRDNKNRRRAYIDYSSRYSYAVNHVRFAPHGLVYRDEPEGQPIDPSIWNTYITRGLFSKNIVKDLDISKAISIYGYSRYDTGSELLREGKRDEASEHFERAIEVNPGLRARAQAELFAYDRLKH